MTRDQSDPPSSSLDSRSISEHRSELLHLLDKEIEQIYQNQKGEGWTFWAILGGIATILWVGLQTVEGSTLSWPKIFVIVLEISFLFWAYQSVAIGMGLDGTSRDSHRFKFIDKQTMSSLLWSSLYVAGMELIAIKFSGNVHLLVVTVIVIVLFVFTITLLAFFILHYLRLPIITSRETHVATRILFLVFALCFVVGFGNTYWDQLHFTPVKVR